MTATGLVDVVCLGESMVTFLPTRPGRLADVPSFVRGIGGAESNVACGLASSGHSAKWVGRVGEDGFGEHLVAAIASYGVDTSAVQRDAHRPTGIYFRTAGERATGEGAGSQGLQGLAEVVYYRAGSAASAMSPSTMPADELWSGRILHLSGITAALSADCLALMRTLTARAPGRPLISFDVNYRMSLWRDADGRDADGRDADGRDADGPRILLDLARGADLVFVGEDEAYAAWGLRGAPAIRAALPEPEALVVKQGGHGATAYVRGGEDGTDAVTFVPALDVDVVAPVGAGDAFAAGFLSATLRGLTAQDRLRHGHLLAAATLTVPGDLAEPPSRAHADRLAALDDRAWGTLRLGPGWTAVVAQDPQEVRTA